MSIDRTYVIRRDGERLDKIARSELGSELGGTVEAILNLTPGLARLGALPPLGTEANLPARPAAGPPRKTVPRIWGDS